MKHKVATLGPKGSFSHIAARKLVEGAEIMFFDCVEDVVREVEEGGSLGVVPIENSLQGSVGEVLDAILSHDVMICGEVVLEIRHHLLSRASKIEEIEVVVSHPQALAQCRSFVMSLTKEYGIKVLNTTSTSNAAELASKNPTYAAIASEEAAREYSLHILKADVQDRKENYTRFVLLSREVGEKTGRDKTLLAVYLKKDRPGALYEILGEFARRGINLTRIESRSKKREMGEYFFFIDLEGHVKDEVVADALKALREKADEVKVLGSYGW
jgi:prephenate dehydratase